MTDTNFLIFPRVLVTTALVLATGACSGTDDGIGMGESLTPSSPTMPDPGMPDTPTTGDDDDESSGDPPTTGDGSGGAASGGDIGPVEPLCGNGKLDPDEECDLGVGHNSNEGACTLMCKHAVCGDGLVWAGVEACDHGPDNSSKTYGGCTTECKWGPSCGDGIVQDYAGEECDLGQQNGTGQGEHDGVPCDDGCRFAAKVVFLSSKTFDGYFVGDHSCRQLAKAAGLDNHTNFRAWLSTATSDPATDFTPHSLPLVQRNGVRVAYSLAQLFGDGPNPGITVTETGETLLLEGVWTGTGGDGKLYEPGTDCNGWLSNSPVHKGRLGISSVADANHTEWYVHKEWTSFLTDGCHQVFRIYCIEQ